MDVHAQVEGEFSSSHTTVWDHVLEMSFFSNFLETFLYQEIQVLTSWQQNLDIILFCHELSVTVSVSGQQGSPAFFWNHRYFCLGILGVFQVAAASVPTWDCQRSSLGEKNKKLLAFLLWYCPHTCSLSHCLHRESLLKFTSVHIGCTLLVAFCLWFQAKEKLKEIKKETYCQFNNSSKHHIFDYNLSAIIYFSVLR